MADKERKCLGQFYLVKNLDTNYTSVTLSDTESVGESTGVFLYGAAKQAVKRQEPSSPVAKQHLSSTLGNTEPYSLANNREIKLSVTCFLQVKKCTSSLRKLLNNSYLSFKLQKDGSLAAIASPNYSVIDIANMALKYSEKLFAMQAKQSARIKLGPFSAGELSSYQAQTAALLENFLAKEAELRRLATKVSRYTFKYHVSRWGACYASGRVNFNPALALLSVELAEYVFVHEFCHLKEMNHSKEFWQLVARYCPHYLLCRRSLRQYNLQKD